MVAAATLLSSAVSAAPVAAGQQPVTPSQAAELSAESCARNLTPQQLDALVGYMLRGEQPPSATACYWALSLANQARVGEALLLAKGISREQLARERAQNAGPPRATPRFRPSGQAGILATFFVLNAPWGSNTGTGTRASSYYQNDGCDSDPTDSDWEYEFPLNVSTGQEASLRYYNTNWGVDAGLKTAYSNGILTYGYHDWGRTWGCIGQTAWSLGLGNVANSLYLYKQ